MSFHIDPVDNLKVGQSFNSISQVQAINIHDIVCECKKAHIIEQPMGRIEKNTFWRKKHYDQKRWVCLSCNWASEIETTRTL